MASEYGIKPVINNMFNVLATKNKIVSLYHGETLTEKTYCYLLKERSIRYAEPE